MAVMNVLLCVAAIMLTYGPLLIHAECKVDTCSFNARYRCLSCTSVSKDELLEDLYRPEQKHINGLETYNMNISHIPANDPRLLNMSYIHINKNKENVIVNYIENMTNIKYFEVSYSDSNDEFTGFYVSTPYNLSINFRGNNIKTIKSLCLGHYPQGWSLLLHVNQIKSFTKSSVQQSNCSATLRRLDLPHNELTSLSADVFLELPSLEIFNVRYNKITEFNNNLSCNYEISKNNKSFQSIKLKYFNIESNKLSKLNDESFRYFYNLEYLILDKNRLRYVSPGTFSHLKKLKTLSLSYNLLTYLDPQTFSNLNSLETLEIHGNKLVIFELRNFQPNLNSLKKISIIRNQWDCGALIQLITYLSSKRVDYKYIGESTINSDNVKNINCYPSNILPRITQLGYNITSLLNPQANLSQHELTAEQRLVDINIAELQHLKRHLLDKTLNYAYSKECDAFNVSGVSCVTYMLRHIEQLEVTINNKLQLENMIKHLIQIHANNTYFQECNANNVSVINCVRYMLKHVIQSVDTIENKLADKTTINDTADLINSLNETKNLLNKTKLYNVVLYVVVAALVVLLLCERVYRRYKGRGGVTHEQPEVVESPRSLTVDQPAYLYKEASRDAHNQQEPEYSYVEAPREAGNQQKSCIYENIDSNGPSCSPDQGGEYVVMSPVAAAEVVDLALSSTYDQLA